MSRINYSEQDKNDSHFFRLVFQYLYTDSRKTLSDIAAATGFSTNALTLMKNGQKVVSFPNFARLYYSFTGNEFNFDESILHDLSDSFSRIVEAHIRIDEENMHNEIRHVQANKDKYENSFGFFIYHLVEFFDAFWTYDNDSMTRLPELDKIHHEHKVCSFGEGTYTQMQKAFFLDIAGLQSIEEGAVKQGIQTLELAKTYAGSLSVEGLAQSIDYHRWRIADRTGEALKGYLQLDSLSSYYASPHNLLRYVYIQNVMVYLLTDLGCYEQAEELAQSLIAMSFALKDPDVFSYVNHTLVWNAIAAGWNEKALDYLRDPQVRSSLTVHILGYEAVCLLRLDRVQEARSILLQARLEPRPRKIELLHEMLWDLCEGRRRMFLRSNKAFRDFCCKRGYRQSEKLAIVLRAEVTGKLGMKAEYQQSLEEIARTFSPNWQLPDPS